MDSKGNQLVKKRLLKFWVVLGLYGLPTGSATDRSTLFNPLLLKEKGKRLLLTLTSARQLMYAQVSPQRRTRLSLGYTLSHLFWSE